MQVFLKREKNNHGISHLLKDRHAGFEGHDRNIHFVIRNSTKIHWAEIWVPIIMRYIV